MELERLEILLFDDQKIVTAVTLARHTDISVEDAKESLVMFYNSNKGKNGLWAIYTITGEMERNGLSCTANVLAKESELEEKKSNFQSVSSVDIFSLQTKDVEDIYSVFLSDMMEDKDFFRTDGNRAPIKTAKVEKFRLEMETKHKSQLELIEKAMETKPIQDIKPKVAAKKQVASEKPDLKKLFEKACTKEKTPRNSPTKPPRESPFSSSEKKKDLDSSSENNKRRARKIIIDDEDSNSPPPKEPKKEVETTPVKKEEKPAKREKKKKILDDDVFDAAASSPEKEAMEIDEEPVKKRKTAGAKENTEKKAKKNIIRDDDEEDVKPPVRRSPRKHFTQEPAGKRKKMVKSTETFMDDDGFFVTKEVVKEVSVEPEETPAPKPLSPKKVNQGATMKAKPAPKAQSKISSFFTKKT